MNPSTSCMLLLKQTNELLEKKANQDLRRHGLTLSQMNILRYLYQTPGHELEQKQIESYLQVAQPTVVGLVNRLEKKGLIETYFSPEDHRRKIVRLTEDGNSVCDSGREYMEDAEQAVFRDLSKEDQETLVRLLTVVRNSIS